MTALFQNVKRDVHIKYVLSYLRKLMQAVLTALEYQIVMLHCGMYTKGQPVNFSVLAQTFHLSSPQEAAAIYQEAVRKTRAAIPGSQLENWIVCYHLAYYPDQTFQFYVEPNMPVPVWCLSK